MDVENEPSSSDNNEVQLNFQPRRVPTPTSPPSTRREIAGDVHGEPFDRPLGTEAKKQLEQLSVLLTEGTLLRFLIFANGASCLNM